MVMGIKIISFKKTASMKKSIPNWILCGFITLFFLQPVLNGKSACVYAGTVNHKSLLEKASEYLKDAPNKTLEITLKVIEGKDSIQDSAFLLRSYFLTGEAYRNLGQLTSAEEMYSNALGLSPGNEDKQQIALALNNLAAEFEKKGENKRAARILHQIKNLYKDLNDEVHLAQVYYDLGKLDEKDNDIWAANEYYRLSLESAEKIKNRELILKNYKTISDLYAANNFYKNSYVYFKKWVEYRDSIKEIEARAEMAAYKNQYDQKKQKLDEEAARNEKELQLARTGKTRLYRNAGILTGILLLIIVVVLMLYGQIKNKLSRMLSGKNSQIEEQNIRLTKMNDSFKQANKELRLSEKALRDSDKAKDRLINVIAQDISVSFEALKKNNDTLQENFDSLTNQQKSKLIEENEQILKNVFWLIDNILLWAKVQGGKLHFTGKQTEIKPVIDKVFNSFQKDFEARGVELRNEILNIQDAYCDVFLLDNILKNILNFLSKYDIDGSVISISAFERIKYLEVCIENIGPVRLPENLNKLFCLKKNPCRTDDVKEDDTSQEGLLEMQICKKFVELSGGNIWVNSLPGSWNKICFTLQKSGPAYLHPQRTVYGSKSTVA